MIWPDRVLCSGEEDHENWFEPRFQVHSTELLLYATENPGVLQGSYWRINQFLAYLALIGHPLTAEQVDSIEIHGWSFANPPPSVSSDYPVDIWLKAQKGIPTTTVLKQKGEGPG